MISTLIIEDEVPVQELIVKLLPEVDNDIYVVGTCGDIQSAQKLIHSQRPKLVFLDIMLPGGTAFDLLENLKEIDFEIIFITAYNDFLTNAIKYAANGYLLKPVSIADLKQAIGNAKKRLLRGLNASALLQLIEKTYRKQLTTKKIAIPAFSEYLFIDIDNIVRCESQGSYSYIFTKDHNRILSSFTLKQLSLSLPEDVFFQIHKSHVVSLQHVSSYNVHESLVIMCDKTQLPISRRRKGIFMERFMHIRRDTHEEDTNELQEI